MHTLTTKQAERTTHHLHAIHVHTRPHDLPRLQRAVLVGNDGANDGHSLVVRRKRRRHALDFQLQERVLVRLRARALDAKRVPWGRGQQLCPCEDPRTQAIPPRRQHLKVHRHNVQVAAVLEALEEPACPTAVLFRLLLQYLHGVHCALPPARTQVLHNDRHGQGVLACSEDVAGRRPNLQHSANVVWVRTGLVHAPRRSWQGEHEQAQHHRGDRPGVPARPHPARAFTRRYLFPRSHARIMRHAEAHHAPC